MEKKELRAQIKALKKQHTKEQLMEQSEKILAKLEQHPDFVKAERIMLYSALPDEVQTQTFLEKWHLKKKIILPTVVGDDIIPVEYAKDTDFAVGDFNILEPQNEPYHGEFDLIAATNAIALAVEGHAWNDNQVKITMVGLVLWFKDVEVAHSKIGILGIFHGDDVVADHGGQDDFLL